MSDHILSKPKKPKKFKFKIKIIKPDDSHEGVHSYYADDSHKRAE